MDPQLLDLLRADLELAQFRVPSVRSILGEAADLARERGSMVPALRVLDQRDPSPLATIIRLWLLGQELREVEVDAALPRLRASGARELGLLESLPGSYVRATLSLGPVEIADAHVAETTQSHLAHWYLISDLDDQLRRGPARPDHVMGVGGATRSLISQAPPGTQELSLDLGTGSGVVAMHLALRGPVIATDISERALTLARANAHLNQVKGIEFRRGDLCEPVKDEQFSLILSNPPFVIAPVVSDDETYEYRSSGLVGDELVRRVIHEVPRLLRADGTMLALANWEYHWGSDGLGRVGEWIESAQQELSPTTDVAHLSAWVIERDRVGTVNYAETWARDGGARIGSEEFDRQMNAQLDDFERRRVTSVGLGSVRIRREPGEAVPLVHAERASGPFSALPPGAALTEVFHAGVAAARASDAEVLGAVWLVAPDVAEVREHRPGEESPRSLTLSTEAGIARRVTADTVLAAAIGACDGDLTLAQIADALAQLLELDGSAVREVLAAGARELAWFGMLTRID